jgi:7-keto-8-aminopelargonate synthetase-like enzyme
LIYSTALPAAAVAAANEALAIGVSEPWRREHVHELGVQVRAGLGKLGLEVGDSQGPIVPVRIGDPLRTVVLAKRLLDDGFFVPAIRPPTVPTATARLRVSLSAAHQEWECEAMVESLARFLVID